MLELLETVLKFKNLGVRTEYDGQMFEDLVSELTVEVTS